jgi:hypothetical protein
MPIKSGRYFITNVQFKNQAFLPNPNSAEPVQTRYKQDNPGEEVRVHRRPTFNSYQNPDTLSSGTSLIARMDIMELRTLPTTHNSQHLGTVLKRESRSSDGKEIKHGLSRKLESKDSIRWSSSPELSADVDTNLFSQNLHNGFQTFLGGTRR